jgi:hypothetical protein
MRNDGGLLKIASCDSGQSGRSFWFPPVLSGEKGMSAKFNLSYPRCCPFCRSKDLKLLELDKDAWSVECRNCQAIGPIKSTATEAILAWNGEIAVAC